MRIYALRSVPVRSLLKRAGLPASSSYRKPSGRRKGMRPSTHSLTVSGERIDNKIVVVQIGGVLRQGFCCYGYLQRPLTRLLRCGVCHRYMVGQENKKKQLHYYRCLKCRGANMNAFTTPKAKRKGAHDLFVEFLDKYRLPDGIAPLVRLQLTKFYHFLNDKNSTRDDGLRGRLSDLEKKVKNLKIRHGMGEVDEETYALTLDHLNTQIQETSKELGNVVGKISNLDKLLASAFEKLGKLSAIWHSSDSEDKRRVSGGNFL